MASRHTIGAALLIVFGIVIIGYLTIDTLKQSAQQDGNPYEGITRPKLYAETPIEGEASTRLVLYEFGDFFCAACKANQEVIAQIYAAYGDSVAHAWKDFPFVSPESKHAAIAARCAGSQGAFWEYHDWLFDHQTSLGSISYEQGALDIGINVDQFSSCFSSGEIDPIVERDFLEGQALGVDITPSYVVGDYAFAGPVTYETLERVIQLQTGQ